jgi:SAM-dependent methyltransferase
MPAIFGLGVRATLARTDDNKRYWESVGGRYNDGWEQPGMAAMSRRERALVLSTVCRTPAHRVLDVGIGNGRIIDTILEAPGVESVYGIDIAEEMVKVCRAKYAGDPRVQELVVCDLAREPLPFDGPFDFVSAVRVLKYSAGWRDVLTKVAAVLAPEGLFLFSMPNRNSLNRWSRYPVPSYTTTTDELAVACRRSGLRIVDVTSFSKIPTRFYVLSDRVAYRDVLLKAEGALDAAVGTARFGRELFVIAERSGTPS